MRELEKCEILQVQGGYSLNQHTPSFMVANMLTFAGISTLLALVLGKEVLVGALLAEGIYGGTMYFLQKRGIISPINPQPIPPKGELPSIVIIHPK